MNFYQEELPNGLQVIAEINPDALSTAVGFFVNTGARDETAELAGVSHFLEHMAFKGTETRSAEAVNREFDEIGAKYNAYTTEEHTVYYGACLLEYLPRIVDLLGDLIRPALRDQDFETEKKVILEEIAMYADSPYWTAYEQALRNHFLDHPLGNSVLGSVNSVSALSADQMKQYHAARYAANNIVVVGSGKLDWSAFRDLIADKSAAWQPSTSLRPIHRQYRSAGPALTQESRFVQQWLHLITPAPAADSPLRHAADLLACILGDETGSRFYWTLNEPGLAESVDFSYHEYHGLGLFITSLSCEPERMAENLQIVKRVLREVQAEGITPAELAQAQNKVAARLVLSAERPQNRLSALGYDWTYRNAYHTVASDLSLLRAISVAQLRAVLEEYPLLPGTVHCQGPITELPELVELASGNYT